MVSCRPTGCTFFLVLLRLCVIQDTACRCWRLTSDKWLRADGSSLRRPCKRPTKCDAYNGLPTESGSFNIVIEALEPIAKPGGRPMRCGNLYACQLRNCLFVVTGASLSSGSTSYSSP